MTRSGLVHSDRTDWDSQSTRLKEVFSAKEIKDYEKSLFKKIDDDLDLMKKAALAAANQIHQYRLPSKKILILFGPGNNGGDGVFIGSFLQKKGYQVELLDVLPKKKKTRLLEKALQDSDLQNSYSIKEIEIELHKITIIDAVFGIGGRHILNDELKKLMRFVNDAAVKIAIDIPTGVCSDSEKKDNDAFAADYTITFIGYKIGQILGKSKEAIDSVELKDLGLRISNTMESKVNSFNFSDVKKNLPKRLIDSHKSNFGKLTVIAGDDGYGGAGILSCKGALIAGAGLVRLVTRKKYISAALAHIPELMVNGSSNAQDFKEELDYANVIACGPGLKPGYWSEQLMYQAIQICNEKNIPLILDAGALRLIIEEPFVKMKLPKKTIITPHPGEAAALLSCSVSEVQSNRIDTATKLRTKYGCIVVLKGYQTIIADESIHICENGTSALAIPGSGDILTGLVGAMVANGLELDLACKVAVSLHGKCGDDYSSEIGDVGLSSDMLIELLRKNINC